MSDIIYGQYLNKLISFSIENCPECIQKLMKKCWQFQSEKRCTFNEIVQQLQGYLEQGSHNLFVNPGNYLLIIE